MFLFPTLNHEIIKQKSVIVEHLFLPQANVRFFKLPLPRYLPTFCTGRSGFFTPFLLRWGPVPPQIFFRGPLNPY